MQTPAQRLRLEQMFTAYHALVWRSVRRLGAGPDEASDVTQQAYLIAAERIDDIRAGSERAFLFSTAIRLARTRYRRERRTSEQDVDALASPRVEGDVAASRHYAQQLLERALSRIDPELVSVFALFELEGFSTQDIAEMFEIPLGTVASKLRRAREQFRAAAARLEKQTKERGAS